MSIEYFPFKENLWIRGQIQPDDVAFLAQQGVKTIVCTRPDNEEPNQPAFNQIEAAAAEHGIQTHYLPMNGLPYIESHADSLKQVLNSQSHVFMYCRSGMRAITLWSYVQQDLGVSIEDIIEQVSVSPYDADTIKTQLSVRAAV